MVVHQVFAHILDTKIKNIIVCDNYEVANQLARAIYGDTAIAQECTQYPCGIGDYFVDNTFYFRDKDDPEKVGDPVPRKNTAEEDAAEANSKATELEYDMASVTVDVEYLKAINDVEDETYDYSQEMQDQGPETVEGNPEETTETTAETTEETTEESTDDGSAE
jgi:hypothetical protein